ncbi:MAG: DUF4271 domain-containing protein [Flammeovirgaceae bacterium]
MGYTRYGIVFILVAFVGTTLWAQIAPYSVDLRGQWLVPTPVGFQPFDSQSTSSIYFWVPANAHQGNTLVIAGRHPYSVWVNSKLIWNGQGSARFSIDSLARQYSTKIFVSVFSTAGFSNISTTIERHTPVDDTDLMPRKGNYFLDFALIASLMLLISFTLFLRTNPVLTRDYFNLSKLITSLDRTESGFGLRIASSVNVLYYFFGSCFLALILLVAFHLMGPVTMLSKIFQVHRTAHGFVQWMLLSLGIAALLVVKLFWIAIFASLYGFKDTVRFQFFNFVRVIFISVAILVVIGFVFVLFNVRSDLFYYCQLYLLIGLFVIGTVVVYVKLMARLPYHFFHLFSYLCASEIIPLLILTKLILY